MSTPDRPGARAHRTGDAPDYEHGLAGRATLDLTPDRDARGRFKPSEAPPDPRDAEEWRHDRPGTRARRLAREQGRVFTTASHWRNDAACFQRGSLRPASR